MSTEQQSGSGSGYILETREHLHTAAQVIGEYSRQLRAPLPFWHHLPFTVTATGYTTGMLSAGSSDTAFSIEFDFSIHRIIIRTIKGERWEMPLQFTSAAELAGALQDVLTFFLGSKPVDPDPALLRLPFSYDPGDGNRFWEMLTRSERILQLVRSKSDMQSTPVFLYPHHFDLAVSFFTGGTVDGKDSDKPEEHLQQITAGFTLYDEHNQAPYFYVTAYPFPAISKAIAQGSGFSYTEEQWKGFIGDFAELQQDSASPEEQAERFVTIVKILKENMAEN